MLRPLSRNHSQQARCPKRNTTLAIRGSPIGCASFDAAPVCLLTYPPDGITNRHESVNQLAILNVGAATLTVRAQELLVRRIRGIGIAISIWALGVPATFAGNGAEDLALVGPAERLDCASGEVQLLGIRLRAVSAANLALDSELQASGNAAYLAATARIDRAGSARLAKLFLIQDESYVAGASTVFVRGTVTSANFATGQFEVSGSRFSLFESQLPSVGAFVEVVGTQPQFGGPILVNTFAAVSKDGTVGSGAKSTAGMVGSGATTSGIVGSGASTSGIVGSGASTSGIVGSGASTSGIVGSGATTSGIVGSGASTSGIVGSGASTSGIVGSGASTSGIVGSGASTTGIVGSGATTSGIVGSGASTSGIVGSGASTSGIVGSGASTSGIVGSGASTSGIVGSGATTSGIVGSGASTSGIVGSGASTSGIVGSGTSTSGIVGSGASTSGIVGSGASTSGIVGSGTSTSGIVGSGARTSGIVGSGASTNGIVGSGATTSGIVGSGASTSGIVGSGF